MINKIFDGSATQMWRAPAKLNLFLHIIGQLENGYHLLQSVIQFIDLCDELKFIVRSDGLINGNNSNQNISPQDDLSIRAASLMQKNCSIQLGVDIEVKKLIPLGAGLGGGSSDAATTLLALNQLWGCDLETQELENLGKQLGADVPIFIRGKASWVEGIGDELESVTLPEPWYVVVFPNVYLDTKQMYKDPHLTRNCTPIKIRDFTQQHTTNVFEPIACRQPEVARAFQWLTKHAPARLTGSGSGLFAQCDTRQQAVNIAATCPTEFIAYVVKGMNHSPIYS